jgi:hypothetical protein
MPRIGIFEFELDCKLINEENLLCHEYKGSEFCHSITVQS